MVRSIMENLRQAKLRIGQTANAGASARSAFGCQDCQHITKFLIEETRLGIPAIIHEECCAGAMGPRRPVFPQISRASQPSPSCLVTPALSGRS